MYVMFKGIDLTLSWRLLDIEILTDFSTVLEWAKSMITNGGEI